MLSQDFEPWSTEDLLELIRSLELPLVDMVPLTARPSGPDRACFRLDLADGRTFKGRIVGTDDEAARIASLMELLDTRHFPKVLARRGCALLTDWIDGSSLDLQNCQLDLLSGCGFLQGSLHTIPLPLEQRYGNHLSSLERQAQLQQNIQRVEASGMIGKHECRSLMELARAHAPDTYEVGLIHGDFCAENMVLDDRGHVHVIDNETLMIDALDYDLARTWYRWPLNSIQLKAYFRGYAHHRSLETFLAHFPYWAISALVDSAIFRLRCDPRELSTPLERLRNLFENLRDPTHFASVFLS